MTGEINFNTVGQATLGNVQQYQRGKGLKSEITNIQLSPTSSEKTIKQHKDGSFSEITVTKDGTGVHEQETIYGFDADGNKVVKSVRRKEQPFYGLPSETEYIDSDGDGFADCEVKRCLDGKGKPTQETKTNYPDIKDVTDGCERHKRRMALIDKGNNICY